jgi:hypothetical protein
MAPIAPARPLSLRIAKACAVSCVTGVKVVTICPGYIDTPLTQKNRYAMPFLMPAEAFADKAFLAIEGGVSYRVIPWQMGVVAKLLRVLPNALFDGFWLGVPANTAALTKCESWANKKGPSGPFLLGDELQGNCLVAVTATAVTTAAAATAAATTSATAVTAAATTTVAATATTPPPAATAETTAASAGRTCFHGTCFVHHQTAAAELLTIHAADSGLCFCIAAHFHKAEAFGAASVTFHHDFGAGNGTVGCKRLLQVFVTERIRQVAHVKFVAHVRTPQNNSKRDGVQTRNQQTNEDLKQTRNW